MKWFEMVRLNAAFANEPFLSNFTVVISNRLVTSPCAIVADEMGYTANVEKLISM